MARRINLMAPYFVQLRELERQLILSTIDAARRSLPTRAVFNDYLHVAAELLGVEFTYLRVRCRVLGGILENDLKHEPPIPATKAWSKERVISKSKSPKPDEEADPSA